MEIYGGCLCGSVRFYIKGKINSFYLCHCSRCQKSSGSAHASNLFFGDGILTWEKGENMRADYRHEDTRFGKCFCRNCGCPLPRIIDSENKIIQVPAGSLDGDQYFEPTAQIFTDSEKCWEKQLSQAPKFPGIPNW